MIRYSIGILFLILAVPAASSFAQMNFIPQGTEDVVVVIEKTIPAKSAPLFITHGTGFFLTDSAGNTFLVTNRHILQGHDSLFVRFNFVDGSSTRRVLRLKRPDGTDFWKGDADTMVDLAAVPIPDWLSKFRYIDCMRIKPIREVKAGDPVYFVGFPLLEYTGRERVYGVFRHGIVSYIAKEAITSILNPDSIIMTKGMILIDATSLGGNSGSPVLSTPRAGDKRASLIGVVSGHLAIDSADDNIALGRVEPAERLTGILASFKPAR